MTTATLKQKDNNRGLDDLVQSLTDAVVNFKLENFLSYIDMSLQQLETDDTISPEYTDQIADALLEARELYLDGQSPWDALNGMLAAYQRARAEKTFYQQWVDRANSLTSEELRSRLWDQFQEACVMVSNGQGALLQNWLRERVRSFEAASKNYDSMMVAVREVTMESTLCHLFLSQGMQAWKEALELLRKSKVAPARMYAERGQRFLLAVQMYEREAALVKSNYFVD